MLPGEIFEFLGLANAISSILELVLSKVLRQKTEDRSLLFR